MNRNDQEFCIRQRAICRIELKRFKLCKALCLTRGYRNGAMVPIQSFRIHLVWLLKNLFYFYIANAATAKTLGTTLPAAADLSHLDCFTSYLISV
jgi:hypothetical protein